MKRISTLPLFALILIGTALYAQNGTLYSLRMKFAVGTVSRYQTNAQVVTSIPLGAGSEPIKNTLDVDLLQSLRVNKVTAKGAGEIATTTQSGRITMNGKTIARPDANEVVTSTYDTQGNLLKVTGLKVDNSGGGAFGGLVGSGALNLQRVYLPTKPVKIGESWTTKVTIAGLPGAGTGSAKSTFVRLEPVGRYQTARIRAVLTAPLKLYLTADSRTTTNPKLSAQTVTGTLNMTFDSNLALAEGKVVRSGGSGTAVMNLTPTVQAKPAPQPASKPTVKTANGKTKPTTKPATSSPPPIRVTLILRVGNNLIE